MLGCCIRKPIYPYNVPSLGTQLLTLLKRFWYPLKRLALYWPNELRMRRARKRGFDPMLISLVKRTLPNIMAYDFVNVQPMYGPNAPTFHKTYRTRRKHQWFLDHALFHGTKYQQVIYVDFSKQINGKNPLEENTK